MCLSVCDEVRCQANVANPPGPQPSESRWGWAWMGMASKGQPLDYWLMAQLRHAPLEPVRWPSSSQSLPRRNYGYSNHLIRSVPPFGVEWRRASVTSRRTSSIENKSGILVRCATNPKTWTWTAGKKKSFPCSAFSLAHFHRPPPSFSFCLVWSGSAFRPAGQRLPGQLGLERERASQRATGVGFEALQGR